MISRPTVVTPNDDERFMAHALAIGQEGLGRTWPNPSVGAIIVRHGANGPHIIAQAGTAPAGRPHAEPLALAQAGEGARGATLYVTLEPCSHQGRTPPCADALVASGLSRVVAAIEDPDHRVSGRGVARMRAAGIWVTVGVGAKQARMDHAGHISRVTLNRPHVLLKMAISADGKAGRPGPAPAAITGPAARARVHSMRAHADVILVGIGTVLSDDPMLTCRLSGLEQRSPVRVVLDTMLRLPLDGRLVESATQVPLWVVAAEDAPEEQAQMLVARGVEVYRVPRGVDGRLDLEMVLKLLSLLGVTRVMVEGGPHLADALLEAGLVDEVAVFQAPLMLGPDALDALAYRPLSHLLAPVGFVQVEEDDLECDHLVRLVRR